MFAKLLLSLLTIQLLTTCADGNPESSDSKTFEEYEIRFQWSFVNFTWESPENYNDAITSQRYIPQNTAITSIKFYKNKLYLALAKSCPGTPITLGYISVDEETPQTNPLVIPFPDWKSNDLTNNRTCDKLEDVLGIEIDADGILWVLDGVRTLPNSLCPPKLVLYDLNDNFKIVRTYTFPEQVALSKNALLRNIVIDDTDGTFAYIADGSPIDPGLIVYSKEQDTAWKIRHPSMFPAKTFNSLEGINGIALSPKNGPGPRNVFYCVYSGLNLYSISTDILKNKSLFTESLWRKNVTNLGEKLAQSDNLIIDSKGNLYYGMRNQIHGIGRWNIYEPFSSVEIVDQNELMLGPYSFTFDDEGYLFVLPISTTVTEYFASKCQNPLDENEIKFRAVKHFAGAQSYLY